MSIPSFLRVSPLILRAILFCIYSISFRFQGKISTLEKRLYLRLYFSRWSE